MRRSAVLLGLGLLGLLATLLWHGGATSPQRQVGAETRTPRVVTLLGRPIPPDLVQDQIRAVEQLPTSPKSVGAPGVLVGRCLRRGAENAPLGGARVALQVHSGAGLPPIRVGQGTTGRDGRFRIAASPSSRWTCALLVIECQGLASHKVALDEGIAREGGDLGDLLIPGDIPVAGRLMYPDGRLAAGWEVRASVYRSLGFVSASSLVPLAASAATARSDGDGYFEFEALPAGLLWIQGRPDATSVMQDLCYMRLLDATAFQELLLTVRRPGEQVVRFVSGGNPVHASVRWHPLGTGVPSGTATPVGPDRDGWWRFSLVQGVRYDVLASPEGHRPVHLAFRGSDEADRREVTVVPGTVSVHVQLEPQSDAQVLVGIVGTGSRSRRLPFLDLKAPSVDGTVTVGSPHAPLSAGKRVLVTSLDATHYWISGPLTESDLQVGAPPLVLRWMSADMVRVHCTSLPGNRPIDGVEILVQRRSTGGTKVPSPWGPMMYTDSGPVLIQSPIVTATTVADGSAVVPVMPEFDLELRCRAAGFREGVVHATELSGLGSIHVEMQAGHRIIMEASDESVAVWGRPALLALSDRGLYRSVPGKSGEFVLDGAPRGACLLGPAAILSAIRHLPGLESLAGIAGVEHLAIDSGKGDVRVTLSDPGRASFIRGELQGVTGIESYLVECLPGSSSHSAIVQKPVGVLPGGEFLIGPFPAGVYDLRVYFQHQLVEQVRVAVDAGQIYEAPLHVDHEGHGGR